MLRSAAATRAALYLSSAVSVCLSACAPDTASSDGVTAGAGAVTTAGSSTLAGVAGVGASGTSALQVTSTAGRGTSAANTAMTTAMTMTTTSGNAGARAAGAAGTGTGVTSPSGFATAGGPAMTGGAGMAAIGGSPAHGTGGSGSPGAAGTGQAGAAGAGTSDAGNAGEGETGRLVGITAAHNVVRARIMNPTPNPPLPPLKWSSELAEIAQTYADKLASEGGCRQLVHSGTRGLGENLAAYGGLMATPEDVVEGWAGEEECYTFGSFMRDDNCDMNCTTEQHSNGCGHYTQVVWRGTSEVGCGMATCGSGFSGGEVWVCNYRAPGNYVGMKPY